LESLKEVKKNWFHQLKHATIKLDAHDMRPVRFLSGRV